MPASASASGRPPAVLDWSARLTADDPGRKGTWPDDLALPIDEELDGLLPDPSAEPPDDDDAWVPELPPDDFGVDPDLSPEDLTQVPEALPGLLPRRLGNGAGFGAGGAADQLAPGPALAGLTEDTWHAGPEQLTDDELVGVMLAWRRLNSWTAAKELAVVAELERRRTAQVAAGADPHLAEHLADELAVALTLTTRSADRLLDFAAGLSRLPRTAAALAAGEIDRVRALVIVDEASPLAGSHAAAVEAAVIGRAARQTTGQLRAAVRQAVLAADPAAARKRQEKAQKDARVEVWDERSGTAALAGRDLPPADVLAADERIGALARRLKTAGHEGTLDQLRARVYTALLLGQPVDNTSLPDTQAGEHPHPPPGRSPGACARGERPPSRTAGSRTGERGQHPPPQTTDTQAGEHGRRSSHSHGQRHDYPAALAAGPSGHERERSGGGSCRGQPEHGGAADIPPGLAGSVHLTMPLATWLGASDAPGEASGFGPVSAGDARGLGTQLARWPGARWCLTFTDATGRAIAHGCAGTPRGNGDRGWELAVTVRPLAVAECTHGRESPGYRPSAGLRHIVNVRQRTCGFPGCRRPATRCDQDHTVPFGQGGRTCECGLAPLCRRHHRAKQVQGWYLDQPEPGILYWRLPHGRNYRVEPGSYPAESGTCPTDASTEAGRVAVATEQVRNSQDAC
jgi:Domain of unknown function (DUF222)